MTTTTLTPSAVSGPLLDAAQVGELAEHLTRRAHLDVVEYARRELNAVINILTMESLANHSLAGVCAQIRLGPWTPLLDGVRAATAERADTVTAATLIPVQAPVLSPAWILTGGSAAAHEHCAEHQQVREAVVVGHALEITTGTGFPMWMDEVDLADATGISVSQLMSTPAQIRAAAGRPHIAVEPRTITWILERLPQEPIDREGKMAASRDRSKFARIISDTAAESGRGLDDDLRSLLADGKALDDALTAFRAASPDPADVPGAVALAEKLLLEQLDAHHHRLATAGRNDR